MGQTTTPSLGGVMPPAATAPKRRKTAKITPRQRAAEGEGRIDKHWRTYFLQALARTSNVAAAAASAGVAASRAYKVRREEPAFAARWREALSEGYEHLEFEVLGHLRCPAPERKFDVANTVRLLAVHAQLVAQQRALEDDGSERDVFDSIDAMIDEMRERSAANAAILAESDALTETGESDVGD